MTLLQVMPLGQDTPEVLPHEPLLQVVPDGQMLPQVPQLKLSQARSMQTAPPVEVVHVPLGGCDPGGQFSVPVPPSCGTPPSPVPGTHCPSEQKESPWQRVPQVPQLLRSVFVSVQNWPPVEDMQAV